MDQQRDKLRIGIAAWEPGRANTGLGAQIGGLGVIIEELPAELIKAAARQGIKLEIEVLTPCFAHYDKTRMKKRDRGYPATLSDITFSFDAYEHVFEDGIKVVYFWDEGQLTWSTPTAIYPQDPQMALRLYASVSQAMAGYIRERSFDTIHLHDYHVGLLPFYLGDDTLEKIPIHLTIHNATYQGITPLVDGGYSSLDRIALPGRDLFHQYFDFFDNLNLMKACMLKVHQCGGKITTVSGDIAGTWGYAAELRQNRAEIYSRAFMQKGSAPGEVFVPNRHLDLFEKLPIAGITNGMSDRNRPENLPELKSEVLKALQEQQKKAGRDEPLFRNPVTQKEMLARDHSFHADHLDVKGELKRLLHLEAFGSEPEGNPILLTAVGRLVDQKNLGLVASIVEWTIKHDPRTKFIILASATSGDPAGMADEAEFARLAYWYRDRVFFQNTFNLPLSKLILAGGDFCLIPSRFEPCGLVDYEASLLGNIVIGRATGGLTKVSHCAYLYDWLDISDRTGEAGAFFSRIAAAIDNYRRKPEWHRTLMRTAMNIDASWDISAAQYLRMYRYGFLMKQWHAERKRLIANFTRSLGEDLHTFLEFFIPGKEVYADAFDWQLKKALTAGTRV
jgi:glycogen synthase